MVASFGVWSKLREDSAQVQVEVKMGEYERECLANRLEVKEYGQPLGRI